MYIHLSTEMFLNAYKGHIINYGRGDRHVRQNSPAIFGDPPYHIGTEIGDAPYSKSSGFCDPPHYHENSEDFNASTIP